AATMRDANLPDAISFAKTAWTLIREGLAINPHFYTLCLAEISARQFGYDEGTVVDLCSAMINSAVCPHIYRQLAFEKLVNALAEGKHFQSALDMINRVKTPLTERVNAVKMFILARHFMIGKYDASTGCPLIIRDVRDYYIEPIVGGAYRRPTIGAE